MEQNLVAASGFFFPVYAVVVLLTRPISGRLFDCHGENRVVYPTLLLMGCGFACLSLAHMPWLLLLSGALVGAGFGNFQSIGQALTVKLAPPHRFGPALSTFYIFFDWGIGLGPYLSGAVVDVVGYRGMFWCTTALAFLCLPAYLLVHGRKSTAQR
ncbi:MAG: MFS transporter [Desulfobulbus sp.]